MSNKYWVESRVLNRHTYYLVKTKNCIYLNNINISERYYNDKDSMLKMYYVNYKCHYYSDYYYRINKLLKIFYAHIRKSQMYLTSKPKLTNV